MDRDHHRLGDPQPLRGLHRRWGTPLLRRRDRLGSDGGARPRIPEEPAPLQHGAARRSGLPTFTVQRPWTWFFSEADIVAPDGSVLGKVEQRWAWFNRKFTVTGRRGQEVAEIFGPLFHPWTFELRVGGRPVGKISKKWSGLLKEAFTDADTFGLELGMEMEADLRLVALGATFLIDFLYFEDRD